ncbi:MAG: hypothetical protein R2831_09500 [Chitinophagaceae bacterium]
MKKIFYFLSFFFLLFLALSVQAKKKKKKAAKSVPEMTQVDSTVFVRPRTPNEQTQLLKDTKTDEKQLAQIRVSFISRGAGINTEALAQFQDFLANYQKENHTTLHFESKPWGREGELDYCFLANEEEQIQLFYNVLMEKFANVDRIFIKQHIKCR